MAVARLTERDVSAALVERPEWHQFQRVFAKLLAGWAYCEDLRLQDAPPDEVAQVRWQLYRLRKEIAPLRVRCEQLVEQATARQVRASGG